MYDYKVKFSVNGIRTETTVKANSASDAQKIVEGQYAGSKLTFWSIFKV